MTFLSYAQNFEDVMLWRALGDVERGFYIDIGAWDPNYDSVTRAFYERDWRGINVEPVPELARRLAAARPGDVNLELAVGEQPGAASFTVVEGTGLSGFAAEAPESRAPNFVSRRIEVAVETLAEICRRHARAPIHFLKIDVEGAERSVLAGADFTTYRPWIVLAEATVPMSQVESHHEWEPILLGAGYRFVWFDGLNRFYVAAEHVDQFAPSFLTPPNSFDNFVRVSEGDAARRIADAEARAAIFERRAARADRLEAELRDAQLREAALTARAAELAAVAGRAERLAVERANLILTVDRATKTIARGMEITRDAERRALEASDWISAIRASTSWKLTSPVRAAMAIARRGASPPEAPEAAAAHPEQIAESAPASAGARQRASLRRVVHQFHSGSAVGDAITQSLLLIRSLLRGMGYESDIFIENIDAGLAGELRHFEELPVHDDYVLIVHHSMGYDAFRRVVALPAPKVLIYHNITPPEFLVRNENFHRYAVMGREQLALMPPSVAACLADSEYNALELRRLGFEAPRACPLLFDIDELLSRAAGQTPTRGGAIFTILFVGRIVSSKGQADLVAAYAHFRTLYGEPSRLVLVGRFDGVEDPYFRELDGAIKKHGVEDSITLTGLVSEAALDGWYAAADVYCSLSHHEGFGVPLIEAAAHGAPVLAWPSGAVALTLDDRPGDDPSGLLRNRSPEAVAIALKRLAEDPVGRGALAARQRRSIDRFRLDLQMPNFMQALCLAGAAPPEETKTAAMLARALRFTIAGHVNKTYSLSSINRAMAMAIDEERPGAVRLIPVETAPTDDLSEVPVEVKAKILELVERPAHSGGPEIVISQHYPVYVPPPGGDARAALFFWEESIVPDSTILVLNASFDAVFASTEFVAKVLRDSGLSIPIHIVGHAPDLAAFRALAERRAMRQEAAPLTFLHVSSCFPRKGVDALLAAYASAFRASDNVLLRIKGFPNPHNDAAQQVMRLRELDADAPAVEVIDRDVGEAELLSLFADADALVLPTRGEGFNLPAAEAMAAGVPVIVTAFGGHLDFCDAGSARLVDYRFAPSGSHLATPHSVWVDPDIEDLAGAMREIAGFSGAARAGERARRASETVTASLGRAAYVDRIVEASVRVLLTPPARPIRLGLISTWGVRCGVAEYSRHLVENFAATDAISEITIFADRRIAASDDPLHALRVTPCWQLGNTDELKDVALAINRADPHVLMFQHQPGLFRWSKFAALMDMIAPRPTVVMLHNTRDVLDAPEAEREATLCALRRFDRVLVHTVVDLNLMKVLGVVGNVTLMPHGALVPRSEKPARPLPRDVAPVIGCYGFFLPDKGLPELVSALALVRKRWPAARLRLVNARYDAIESLDEIAAVRQQAHAGGVADAIEWHTEFLADDASIELLGGCDLIVLPYQRSKEASSASLRMALAAGRPVLVTKLGLFDEAGDAVARCDGVAPADIASGIERLLSDAPERGRIQAAARQWLLDRDWSSIARRLQGMLLGLARQSAAMGGLRSGTEARTSR